jgi:hypothetical protein
MSCFASVGTGWFLPAKHKMANAAHDECDYHYPKPNPPRKTALAGSHFGHIRSPPDACLVHTMTPEANLILLARRKIVPYQQSTKRQMQHTMNAMIATQSQNHQGQKHWLAVTSATSGHLLR